MPTTLAELKQHCVAIGVTRIEDVGEGFEVCLCTRRFVNGEGKRAILVRVSLIEVGRLVVVGAHGIFPPPKDLDTSALLCLRLCHMTSAVQTEFDADARISLVIEHPVEDSSFSRRQLFCYFQSIVEAADALQPAMDPIGMRAGVPIVSVERFAERAEVIEYESCFVRRAAESSEAIEARDRSSALVPALPTIESIESQLRSIGVECEVSEARGENRYLIVTVPTEVYRGCDEQIQLRMLVCATDHSVIVTAPLRYQALTRRGRGRLARLMLKICQETKVFQAEMDEDGEIQVVAEICVLDTEFTAAQLKRLVGTIVGVLDEFDPLISKELEDF